MFFWIIGEEFKEIVMVDEMKNFEDFNALRVWAALTEGLDHVEQKRRGKSKFTYTEVTQQGGYLIYFRSRDLGVLLSQSLKSEFGD